MPRYYSLTNAYGELVNALETRNSGIRISWLSIAFWLIPQMEKKGTHLSVEANIQIRS